jgi:hypothetical protein
MEAYRLGKMAHMEGKPRIPMRDHAFVRYIQTKSSAKHHPNSPGANMTHRQRRQLEAKITEWKRGWDASRRGEDQ